MKTHIVLAGSDILYHGTTSDKAVGILRDKGFYLKSSLLNEYESRLGPNLFYLSTARSLQSHYLRNRNYVIFELDGRQLATRYRIKPVTYFSKVYKNEMEDRVFSTKPVLPIKYIKAVHVPTQDNQYTVVLKRQALKLGIPIYFYDAYTLNTLKEPKVEVPITRIGDLTKRTGNISYREKEAFDLLQLLLLPVSILSKHSVVKKEGYNLIRVGPMNSVSWFESWIKEAISSVPRALHQNHNYNHVVDRISGILRKHKWGTKDLYLYFRAKLEYAITGYTYFDLVAGYRNTAPDSSIEYINKGQHIVQRWTQLQRAMGLDYVDMLIGERQVHKEIGHKLFDWHRNENDATIWDIGKAYRRFHDNRSKI